MQFKLLEGETVILRSRGTFTQNEVYTYNGELFAKKGGGYIRLLEKNATSIPSVLWQDLTVKQNVGEFGRLRG